MDESFEIEGIEEAVVAIETEPTLYECEFIYVIAVSSSKIIPF
jgi:hypothetical protein